MSTQYLLSIYDQCLHIVCGVPIQCLWSVYKYALCARRRKFPRRINPNPEPYTLNPAPPPKKQANLAAKKEKAHELQEAAAEEHKKALADYKKAQV